MILLFSTSNSPTFNLAAEEYLFSERQDELLFLYVNEPSVIIGCNQAIRNEVDLVFCAKNNIQIVRRMSGGGAVYHDLGNLNFCFIKNKIPGEFPLGGEFLNPIMQVLHELDIDVHVGKRKDLWLPDGHKISGTASHVGKNRELYHGTLLYDSNLEYLQKSLSPKAVEFKIKAIASVPSPVKNIRSWLIEQSMYEADSHVFFEILTQKLLELYDMKVISFLLEEEIIEIQKLQKWKYEDNEWTRKK